MKKTLKAAFLAAFIITAVNFPAGATHIVGGDITVKSVGGNSFEVTLNLFHDCATGLAFDPTVTIGIYDKVTNALQQNLILPLVDSLLVPLGDTCYTPPGMCVRKKRYFGTATIPNNPNGYYLAWIRCCRNANIDNIVNPNSSGNIFYAEILNPVIGNSSPTFVTYPDAYMCQNFSNLDDFKATDIDGDSLVYSLSLPLDCSSSGYCTLTVPAPLPSPKPYSTVVWQAPYSASNIMGDPAMAINSNTGILTTKPPTQGLFVFCVRVQEFRAGVQIGEIRRDVQYAVLPCTFPSVSVSGPNPICLGQSTTLSAAGTGNYLWNTGATTAAIVVQPTAVGTYTYSAVTTINANCHVSADTVITVLVQPTAMFDLTTMISCTGTITELKDLSTDAATWAWDFGDGTTSTLPNPGHTFPASGTYTVSLQVTNGPCTDFYQNVLTVSTSSITMTQANVFTPNGDGINDCFQPNITGSLVDPNADCFSMEIYDRWGIQVFISSGGLNVCWDGNTKSGTKAKDGTYYYVIKFGETTYKGYLALLREKK